MFPCSRFAASALAVAASCCAAQTPPTAQQLVITANRIPVPLTQVLGDVVVIDGLQLRNGASTSVEEVLRDMAGVQLSRTGGPGQSAGVFIRGASMANTIVLIDGVRIGSGTLGQAALEALGLGEIERIEVLRGPGSALYGADAVGGVVQVFTRRGRSGSPRVSAALLGGELGSSELQGGVSGVRGDFDYALSLSREASDGVSAVANPADAFGLFNADRDGFRRASFSAQLGWALTPQQRLGVRALSTRLRSQYDSAIFDPVTFIPDPSPDFRNHLRTQVTALSHVFDGGGLKSELTLSQATDELDSGAVVVDRFDTRRRHIAWQPSMAFSGGGALVGLLEHQQLRVVATPFGAAARRADNNAVGLSATGRVDAHLWQVDLRHDEHEVYGGQTTGKLGYGWQVTPQWLLRASAGTAFRAPSFNELYFPRYGVESIRPERARSIEVGATLRQGQHTGQFTLYDNRVRDLIGYQADATACPSGFSFGCAANINRARLRGASLSVQGTQAAWQWRAGAEFLDAKDTATGDRLTRRAARTAHAMIGHDFGVWSLQGTLNAQGRRPEGGAQLAAYELLDLVAHWRFAPQWRFEAKLLNALDKSYEPAKDYGAPGRQAWLGLRFDSTGF